jgi:hypothetical protein
MLNPGLDLSFNINPTFGIQKFAKTKKKQQGHVVQSKRNVASHLFKKKRKQKQKGNGLRLWTTELI